MSDRIAYLPFSSFITRPIATPATDAFSGTPASIMANDPPHTDAIDDEPLDSRISETTRTVYGNVSSAGIIGASERSASAPWPISRRPGPRRNLTSPTENGGEL